MNEINLGTANRLWTKESIGRLASDRKVSHTQTTSRHMIMRCRDRVEVRGTQTCGQGQSRWMD